MTTLERFLKIQPALNRKGAQKNTSVLWAGVANEYDALKTELDKITRNAQAVENLSGNELDELILRYTGIDRNFLETDNQRRLLLRALFYRDAIPSWCTVHSIKIAFSQWFGTCVAVRENEVETNLLSDGSFEALAVGPFSGLAADGEWNSTGGDDAEIADVETYEGNRVLVLEGDATVTTSIAVTTGPYIISAAFKGRAPIIIMRDSDSKYWNFATRSWQVAPTQLELVNDSALYIVFEEPILADDDYNLAISFGPTTAESFRLDYVSIGAKPLYPYIHVIVPISGDEGMYLSVWPVGSDPVADTSYDYASFLDHDYISSDGSATAVIYFQKVLDMIKPAGTKAVFEYIGGIA